jgi:ABC-type transport system involved in multi-copper enzyme maturation permease subunit
MRQVFTIAKSLVLEFIRKKDFYVMLIFLLVLLGAVSFQVFFDIEGIGRYVRDFGYTMVMLFSFIVAVTTASRQIPAEIEARTVYPLLAKPVTRTAVVLGKALGAFIVSGAAFSVYLGIFILFSRGKADAINAALFAQSYFLGLSFLCMAVSVVTLFSLMIAVSANIAISVILYFFMLNFSDIVRKSVICSQGPSSWAMNIVYYLLPHFEFFDMRIRITHAWDPLKYDTFILILVYTFIYSYLCLGLAALIFKRRDL